MKKTVLAFGMVSVAAMTGCGSSAEPAAGPSSTSAAAPASVPLSPDAAPLAVFDGLNPCSLVRPGDAAKISGVAGLPAARNFGISPGEELTNIDACSFVVDQREVLAAVLNLRPRPEGLPPVQDPTAAWLNQQLGEPVLIYYNTPTEPVEYCSATVRRSKDREVTVNIRPVTATEPPKPTSATDNLCAQHRDVLRDIFSRVSWK